MSAAMTLYRYTRKYGRYAAGEEVWYHPSVADQMLRTGLIVVAGRVMTRQPEIETAMAPGAPEQAVTRRGRRRRAVFGEQ